MDNSVLSFSFCGLRIIKGKLIYAWMLSLLTTLGWFWIEVFLGYIFIWKLLQTFHLRPFNSLRFFQYLLDFRFRAIIFAIVLFNLVLSLRSTIMIIYRNIIIFNTNLFQMSLSLLWHFNAHYTCLLFVKLSSASTTCCRKEYIFFISFWLLGCLIHTTKYSFVFIVIWFSLLF